MTMEHGIMSDGMSVREKRAKCGDNLDSSIVLAVTVNNT